ncbi:MAG: lysophospholipid acyltransferase family protein [Methylococcaceae bacterium]
MMQVNSSFHGNKFRLYLGSSAFFVGLILSTIIMCLLILLVAFLPFKQRYALANLWIGFVMWMARVFCGLHYEVEGLENLKSVKTAIILSKHQSAWETLAFRKILPVHTIVLKESLLWIPFWGWAARLLKPIAIDRESQHAALRIILNKGTQYLNEGLWIVIFPEGTRTAPHQFKKFNAGGALLAQKSGYPIIPIAHNAGTYWPRYSFLKYPGTIKVKIGEAIITTGRKTNDINAEAEQWIAQAMHDIQ